MNVNARNYKRSEFRSKVCQVCDGGRMRQCSTWACEKYGRERARMIQVFLREMGHEVDAGTGRDGMGLLLGLRGWMTGPEGRGWGCCCWMAGLEGAEWRDEWK